VLDVYFYSQTTNNTRAFVHHYLDYPKSHVHDLRDYDVSKVMAEQPYVLLTPTYDFGEVPKPVKSFLENNGQHLVAVASFGNKNWGQRFARSGFLVSQEYEVPLLAMIEMRGNEKQGQLLGDKIKALSESYN